jgi:hypothetical protein
LVFLGILMVSYFYFEKSHRVTTGQAARSH